VLCLWVRVLGQLGLEEFLGIAPAEGPAESLQSLLAPHLFHMVWEQMLSPSQRTLHPADSSQIIRAVTM